MNEGDADGIYGFSGRQVRADFNIVWSACLVDGYFRMPGNYDWRTDRDFVIR